ncbi:phage tail tip lysozyme [Lactococcus petauri]|uniref:phage tail tip lysozyme n=1 Tax=Lactococcus petauri TaxID=1940789 RepID=UPI0018AB7D7C|nr:phage tail tip lysozyme [Lactococcus petauri]MDC0826543.1 phage tail tip lysozyme [Lactococcus petauri]
MSDKKNKLIKERYKNSIKRKSDVKEKVKANRTQSARKSRLESRGTLKIAKKEYRLKKKNYQALKSQAKDSPSNELSDKLKAARKEKLAAKNKKKVAQKVYKQSVTDDPAMLRKHMKRSALYASKYKVESLGTKEETLNEAVEIRRQSKQRTQMYQGSKALVRNSYKLSKVATKGTYRMGNRSLNLVKGRGFQVTPEEFSKTRQAAKKYRNFRNRLKASQFGRGASKTKNILASIIRFANAPLKAKNLIFSFVAFLIVFILMMFLTTSNVAVKQSDEELNKSWLYMSELDAKNSDESNSFYSNLDDVMFFMNYKFDDYSIDDQFTVSADNSTGMKLETYKKYVKKLWTALNGKKGAYELKTLEALNKDSKSGYYLSDDSLEELKEFRENMGYSTLDDQLEFPYETENMAISRRYGYERKGEEIQIFNSIETPVTSELKILAPMGGIVSSVTSDDALTITEDGVRITIKGINSSRFIGGESVNSKEYLGKATGSKLTITYEKQFGDDKKWTTVNPGFYFPKVSYLQVSSIADDSFDPGGDVTKRAKAFYDDATSKGYTLAGIAAVLGNFDVESQINSKRAEGDYLSPPVGASKDSWDDPKWLSMGGMDIYGKYPNIVHRGLGWGQWTDTSDGGNRHTLLLNFAKEKKKKWYDPKLQLDFMLNGDSPASRTYAKNVLGSKVATTVPELTNYFLTYWEGNPGDKVAERIQSAQNWYNYFKNMNAEGNGDMNASSKEVYEKYKDKIKPLPTNKEMGTGWPGNAYALGNCTWWVYNREKQLGTSIYPYMGNANQWPTNYHLTPGAKLVSTPKRGDAVVFVGGVANTSPIYGHVGVVEYVNSDGSFVTSEMNVPSPYVMQWRVMKKQAGMYFIRFK